MFKFHLLTLEKYNEFTRFTEESSIEDCCLFYHDDYYRDGDKSFVEDAIELLELVKTSEKSGDPLVCIRPTDDRPDAMIVLNQSDFDKYEIATKFPAAK